MKNFKNQKKELENKITDLKNLDIRSITFKDTGSSTYIPDPLREKVSKCLIQILK